MGRAREKSSVRQECARTHLNGVSDGQWPGIKQRVRGRNVRRCRGGRRVYQHVTDERVGIVGRAQNQVEGVSEGAAGPRELHLGRKTGTAAGVGCPRRGCEEEADQAEVYAIAAVGDVVLLGRIRRVKGRHDVGTRIDQR